VGAETTTWSVWPPGRLAGRNYRETITASEFSIYVKRFHERSPPGASGAVRPGIPRKSPLWWSQWRGIWIMSPSLSALLGFSSQLPPRWLPLPWSQESGASNPVVGRGPRGRSPRPRRGLPSRFSSITLQNSWARLLLKRRWLGLRRP